MTCSQSNYFTTSSLRSAWLLCSGSQGRPSCLFLNTCSPLSHCMCLFFCSALAIVVKTALWFWILHSLHKLCAFYKNMRKCPSGFRLRHRAFFSLHSVHGAASDTRRWCQCLSSFCWTVRTLHVAPRILPSCFHHLLSTRHSLLLLELSNGVQPSGFPICPYTISFSLFSVHKTAWATCRRCS